MPAVFISYRRHDTGFLALEIADLLESGSGLKVFVDMRALLAGVEFDREIAGWIDLSEVVLVLIGRTWAGTTETGFRRIDDSEDIYRSEIRRALESPAEVIPVAIGDDVAVEPATWPEDIRRICDLQWQRLALRSRRSDLDDLAAVVRRTAERVRSDRIRSALGGHGKQAPNMTLFDPPMPAYPLTTRAIFSVNAALATGRPVLVSGPPGQMTRELPNQVAAALGWRFYEFRLTTSSILQDLLYTFDAERRLADAQVRRLTTNEHYIEPGAFWWAFDPASAARRGSSDADTPRAVDSANADRGEGAVVLVDGVDVISDDAIVQLIDTARSRRFVVRETAHVVYARNDAFLVCLTSYERRQLPPGVLGHCVRVVLEHPTREQLVQLATDRVPHLKRETIDLVLDALLTVSQRLEISPPTVEVVLDVLRAMDVLKVAPDSVSFADIIQDLGIV